MVKNLPTMQETQIQSLGYIYAWVLSHSIMSLLCNPTDCRPWGSSVPGIFQTRILEWVAMTPLQEIFLTQQSNPHLLHLPHWKVESLPLSCLGSPVTGIHIFFIKFFSHLDYLRILSIFPSATHSGSLLVIYFKYSSVYMSILVGKLSGLSTLASRVQFPWSGN